MDRYIVIGHPIGHSLSPRIHAAFAQQTGRTLQYDAVLAPRDGFSETVRQFQAQGGMGANVTLPFKQEAYALADEVSERARHAQAANTLSFRNGKITADNTDGAGLIRDLTHNNRFTLAGRSALLIGAGGASRGVLLPLLQAGLSELILTNRTIERAQTMLTELRVTTSTAVRVTTLNALANARFDLVINATSAGLTDTAPELPDGLFGENALAYDMMYSRSSAFLTQSRSQGVAQTADGLGMLVEQAAESFRLWHGVLPETGRLLADLRQTLTVS